MTGICQVWLLQDWNSSLFSPNPADQSDFSVRSVNPTDQSSQLSADSSQLSDRKSAQVQLLQDWYMIQRSFSLVSPDQPAGIQTNQPTQPTHKTSQPSQLQSTQRPESTKPTNQSSLDELKEISKISPKRLRHFYPVTSFRRTHDQSNQFPLVQTGIPAEHSRPNC